MGLLKENLKTEIGNVFDIDDPATLDKITGAIEAAIKSTLPSDMNIITPTQIGPQQGTITWNS